jgi:hypothetical protein
MFSMSRTVIQIGADRVAYDGQKWTPVEGERAPLIANIMETCEALYKTRAASHPDFDHNVARAAAEDLGGQIVEYEPDPPDPSVPPDAVY